MTEKEVQMDDIQLARGNEYLHALVPYGPNKMLRELTRRILVFDKSKIPLTKNEAAHTAQLSLSTDLNYFANELWVWITMVGDRRMFHWMPGRLGYTRHSNKQAKEMGIKWFATEPELLTENEKTLRNIALDSMAVRIKIRDDVSMKSWEDSLKIMSEAIGAEKAYKDLGPPPAAVGIGVLPKAEMDKLDKTSNNKMPHINRCAKRALTEAQKGKFNLQFGNESAGAPADYSEYIHGDVVDVDFEDVTESKPSGLEHEAFGSSKERLHPKYWGRICEKMVDEELAADAFIAAELLAYSPWISKGLSENVVTEYFTIAKEIFLEDENQGLKEVSDQTFEQMFPTPEEIKAPEPGMVIVGYENGIKPVWAYPVGFGESKKEKPGNEQKTKSVQKKPKAKTKAEKPATTKAKKESPSKPSVDGKGKEEPKLTKPELTKKEANALVRMAEDYPAICPTDKQDWATAYKYIDLKESGTNRKEFVKLVNDECNADVRLGMALKLGYL